MKNKILILICVLIFFIGIIGSAIVLFTPKKTNVNIKRDGRLLYSFDLSNTEDSEIEALLQCRLSACLTTLSLSLQTVTRMALTLSRDDYILRQHRTIRGARLA